MFERGSNSANRRSNDLRVFSCAMDAYLCSFILLLVSFKYPFTCSLLFSLKSSFR